MEDAAGLCVAGTTYLAALIAKDHHAHSAELATSVGEGNWDQVVSLLMKSPLIKETDRAQIEWRSLLLACIEQIRKNGCGKLEATVIQCWNPQRPQKLQRTRIKIRTATNAEIKTDKFEFPVSAGSPPAEPADSAFNDEDLAPAPSTSRPGKRRRPQDDTPAEAPAKRRAITIDVAGAARLPALQLIIKARRVEQV